MTDKERIADLERQLGDTVTYTTLYTGWRHTCDNHEPKPKESEK